MSDPYFPSLKDIMTAEHTLNDILVPTPLMKTEIYPINTKPISF